ncbi:MAG TPA: DUF599 domain-containing protein [Gammaproteobacteria bacterium]|nr:DUF599 domain-containing protein [Gammaproteobacteria bacterium]
MLRFQLFFTPMLPQHEHIYRIFFDTELLFHNSLSKLRAMELSALGTTSFIWFIICWMGYALFSRRAAKKRNSLASVLYRYRMEWVKKLSQSGMSEVDAELLASLEKQVSFLASTSLLILASLVTVLGTASNKLMALSSLRFVNEVPLEVIQIKLMVLIFIFIYAFFTFTWSIRQYGFCFILFGSSFNTVKYYKEADSYRAIAVERDFEAMAKVLDRAAHSYNYGIRAYYFAMAALAWFINPWFFFGACVIVVWVLYRREFHSSSLKAMVSARMVQNVHDEENISFN